MSALPPKAAEKRTCQEDRVVPKAAILVGEAEQCPAAPEDALWMDAPDFAVAQIGLRIQSSI